MTGSAEKQRPVTSALAHAGVAVSISHLSKRFGSRPVLADVNIDIQPGEFVAIVGRSGCGKSTLLRLLSGLDVPEADAMRLGGDDLLAVERERDLSNQSPGPIESADELERV